MNPSSLHLFLIFSRSLTSRHNPLSEHLEEAMSTRDIVFVQCSDD